MKRSSETRKWHPTPVLLPGKSHGRRSLVGCSPWGREELDTTERLHFHFHVLEKEMATHSSVLAWRIPGTEEPGGLPSMGLQSRTRLKRLSSSSSSETLGEGGFHFSLYTNLDKNFFSFETSFSFSFSHRGFFISKTGSFYF